jgi:hypothetical protein
MSYTHKEPGLRETGWLTGTVTGTAMVRTCMGLTTTATGLAPYMPALVAGASLSWSMYVAACAAADDGHYEVVNDQNVTESEHRPHGSTVVIAKHLAVVVVGQTGAECGCTR